MSIETVSQAPAAPAAPALHDTTDVEDFGQRIHLVYENAKAEGGPQKLESDFSDDDDVAAAAAPPADEDSESSETPVEDKKVEKPAPVAAAPAAEPSAEEKARKASLANAARLERESVRRSTELANKAAELKAQEARFAERETTLANFEKAYNDPDALLTLLAEKVSPDKMAQFFIEQGQPDKVAERRAKAAQEPVNSEIAKLNAKLAEVEAKAAAAEAKMARAASEKDFAARVLDIKADAPHAARLLNKRPKEFYAMADMAATSLMATAQAEGRIATWDDVIHDVNKQLSDFARDLQDEVATVPSTPEKTVKTTAAAKAPTVSNRAASERSEILSEDEKWDSLPFDERVRRAEKRARQTG